MHQSELFFLKDVLSKCHLQLAILDPDNIPDQCLDRGFRKMIGFHEPVERRLLDVIQSAKEKTIYRVTDSFFCSYSFFRYGGQEKESVVVIGPYLSVELTYDQLLEQSEISGLPPARFEHLEKFYGSLPVLTADNPVFAMLDTFAERIWDSFTVVDVNYEQFHEATLLANLDDVSEAEENAWNMSAIENRYSHENELIQAVATGQVNKAELLMSGFSKLSFERRLADPVRNLKNYCIVMNTLLRKAAESGGVHPLYLDRISSGYAKEIETLTSTEAVETLMDKMLHGYCRLVRKHATKNYSPPVQKSILYISTNLGSDLSLNTLSNELNINASYLSTLFKKETGKTITDFANQKRVQRAANLLKSTKLQVQTISQHCGISDVNYFSKIFKKYTGKTPKEYRKEVQQQIHSV